MGEINDISKIPSDHDTDKAVTAFDVQKFLFILRKNIPVIILILATGIIVSVVIVRYTKPLYQSSSILKLDIKSEASVLGLSQIGENQNFNNISSEIELLRSRLFFDKVLDAVDLSVSVYTVGNILNDEKYPNSPLEIDYKIYNQAYYDRPFYLDVVDNDRCKLTYSQDNVSIEKEYNFGEIIENGHFLLKISKTPNYNADISGEDYFFVINSRNSLINYLSSNLTVEPLNLNANTIQVSFSDYNKYKARDLVNAIDTIYLNYTREEKNKANTQKVQFLDERLSETENRLNDFEDYLEDFTIQNKTTDLENNIAATIQQLNAIDSQRFNINIRLSRLLEIKQKIEQGDSIKVGFTDMKLLSGDLRNKINSLNELIMEKEVLSGSYNANTQAYKKKESEINILITILKSGLDQYISELKDQEEMLKDRKRKLEIEFVGLPAKNTEFTKNQRYYSLYEEFYLSLMQRKAEFQLALAGTVTDFKILSPASLPDKPISPDKWMIYCIGLIGGFLISFFYVGLVYVSNNKINSQAELERITNTPILGSIPFYADEKMPFSKLVIDHSSNSEISEAFRAIRTNMQFLLPVMNPATVSISSTVSNEGKTFLGINLGAAFALSGRKVLLLDLDMRRPKIHRIFGQENTRRGISTLLIEKDNLEDCVKQTPVNGFHYIPAGPTPPNPSELLLSEQFNNLIEKVCKIYDLVILDTPPIGIVTDGVLVMKRSDLQIFIIRADYSKRDFIENLERQRNIHQFSNLTIVLNGVYRSARQNYGNGYGSGYYTQKKKRWLFN